MFHRIEHYLPSQFPLKDFVHHNSLHAFQHLPFHKAMKSAAEVFGYKTYISLAEYRTMYENGEIADSALDRSILHHTEKGSISEWRQKLILEKYNEEVNPQIGRLRANWKAHFRINLDKEVYPMLFRIIGNYLDQGVALWSLPRQPEGLLASLRELERHSMKSFFRSSEVRDLLLDPDTTIQQLLKRIVGDDCYHERYLFDMQFSHPGWSGMVGVVEQSPGTLLRKRAVHLEEFILLELLLELDVLIRKLGAKFCPLTDGMDFPDQDPFESGEIGELDIVRAIWQEAYENNYFDQVMSAVQSQSEKTKNIWRPFQALFCIDDRESSLRNYIELLAPAAETFGTAGFFNLPIYFQPEHGHFKIKVCPNPVEPQYIIKEKEAKVRHRRESTFLGQHQNVVIGWITAQTLGFWSAIKMTKNIFLPGKSPLMVSSFQHMDPKGKLKMERKTDLKEDGCYVGLTVEEMTDRVEGLLKTIGLLDNFAPLIYLVGHGASSINNTYYAGYDCGACCGRPGSVNARLAAAIGNRSDVREGLAQRGIFLSENTRFVGGLHDTTRDEIEFYDTEKLPSNLAELHADNVKVFKEALRKNAVERARRFDLISKKRKDSTIHDRVKNRAVSLFEPRPEWNHATNSLCIVGQRSRTRQVFLDRRSFLQSYDHRIDPDGDILAAILGAITPVCGGINLEYYFSRVDNKRLGAGSKLPHNVMGLIGVANGMEGDLRTGLPQQMVDIHDPLRLLMLVEQKPEVVLSAIQRNPATFEWYANEWIVLVVLDPESNALYRMRNGEFEHYELPVKQLPEMHSYADVKNSADNIPVHIIKAS